MARQRNSGDGIAEAIAAYVGKALGGLVARKDALRRQLADVEREIEAVGRRVARQLGEVPHSRRRARKGRAGTRALSADTRAKMAAAARRRWAAAKKAGKKALG